jgi:hypothetical protein
MRPSTSGLPLIAVSMAVFAGTSLSAQQTADNPATAVSFGTVPLAGVGVIGGYKERGDTDPENTQAKISTSSSGHGWDYRNRSLVMDLGIKKTVNRIVLLDTLKDDEGTASNLAPDGVRIYVSDDNRRFTRYAQEFDMSVKSGDGLTCDDKPVFDVLTLDKLVIRARYIKLHTTYGGDSSNFVLGNIQTGIQVFQLASEHFEIRDLQTEHRILTWGANQVYANLAVPKGSRARLALALSDGTQVSNEHSCAVVSGQQSVDYPVTSLKPGSYELIGKLHSEDGTVEAETRWPLKIFRKLILGHDTASSDGAKAERPAAGELFLINDFEPLLTEAQSAFAKYKSRITGRPKSLALLKNTPSKVLLPACGQCAIYLGLLGSGGGVTVQLNGDPQRKTFLPGSDPLEEIASVTGKRPSHARHDGEVIREVFVRYAELKGQSITLTPSDPVEQTSLAFIKIMSLTPQQIELVSGQRDVSAGKRYIYTEDGYQNWSERDIAKDVGKFVGHAEVEAYSWGIGGSAMYYPTKIGSVLGEQNIFPRVLDQTYVESLRTRIEAGQTPIGMAVTAAHQNGSKVYALYRMNAEYGPPYDDLFNSRFWRQNPQFRIVTNPEGQTNTLLSYAFPEVRKYKLDILREAIQTYDVDGLQLEFLRNPPFFGYERPLAEGFKKEFGRDILARDFKPDATWFKYRARFMTEFMSDLRLILKEEGARKGKSLWLGVRVDWSDYLRQGLDVEKWIKEGLVEMVAAGVNGLGYPYAPADDFIQMAKGTTCKIYGSTSPEGASYRDPTPADDKNGFRSYPKSTSATLNMRRRRCLEYFKQGAQGMYLFNDGGAYLGEFHHLERWGEFEDPLNLALELIERE